MPLSPHGPESAESRSRRALSFSSISGTYAEARPSYPAEAVAAALGELAQGARVVDLGAGTGKLSRVLDALGYDVVAVDPSPQMLGELRRAAPQAHAVAGTAEAIPLASGVAAAVTAAQAYHWFDVNRAHDELARVLRPGGRLVLLWNSRDERVPWVSAVWEHVSQTATGTDVLPDDWQEILEGHPAFGPVEALEFTHEQRLTPEGVVALVASRSNIAVLDEPAKQVVLDKVRATLAEHPDTRGRDELTLPYTLQIFRTTRGRAV